MADETDWIGRTTAVQEQVKEDGFDNEKNDRRRRYKGGDFAEIGGGRHERPVHAATPTTRPRK